MHSAHFSGGGGWPAPFGLPGMESFSLCRTDSLQSSGGYSLTQGASGNYCDMKQRVVWTEQEDELLRELIVKYGTTKWSLIASKIPFKTNRHCRRRWQACMNATGNKGAWTAEEDAKLRYGHEIYGNRWTEIAKLVPGRTDNAAKNRYVAITKGNPPSFEKPTAKLISSSSSVSGSESGLTGEASRCSAEPASGCTSIRKANFEREVPELVSNKKRRLCLDLNVDANLGCDSDSDESALLCDADEGADSCRNTPKKAPTRFWLDLNAPCDGSSGF